MACGVHVVLEEWGRVFWVWRLGMGSVRLALRVWFVALGVWRSRVLKSEQLRMGDGAAVSVPLSLSVFAHVRVRVRVRVRSLSSAIVRC